MNRVAIAVGVLAVAAAATFVGTARRQDSAGQVTTAPTVARAAVRARRAGGKDGGAPRGRARRPAPRVATEHARDPVLPTDALQAVREAAQNRSSEEAFRAARWDEVLEGDPHAASDATPLEIDDHNLRAPDKRFATSVRIVDSTGNPVVGADVRLNTTWTRDEVFDELMDWEGSYEAWWYGWPKAVATARSGSDGSVRLLGFGGGRRTLIVQKGQELLAVLHNDIEETIVLPDADHALQGIVTDDATGRPVVGAQVEARFSVLPAAWLRAFLESDSFDSGKKDFAWRGVATTDAAGRWRLPGAPVGDVLLVVKAEGFARFSDFMRVRNERFAAVFATALLAPAVVTGRVVDADTGAPIRQAQVMPPGCYEVRVFTDDDGRFQFDAAASPSRGVIPPGTVVLTAEAVGYAVEARLICLECLLMGDTPERTCAPPDLNYRLRRSATVSVVCLDRFGQPLPHVVVSACKDWDIEYAPTVTSAAGAATLTDVPQSCKLRIRVRIGSSEIGSAECPPLAPGETRDLGTIQTTALPAAR